MGWDGWAEHHHRGASLRGPCPAMSEVSPVRSLLTTPEKALRQPRDPGQPHSSVYRITPAKSILPRKVTYSHGPEMRTWMFQGQRGHHPAYHSRNRGSERLVYCHRASQLTAVQLRFAFSSDIRLPL